MRIIEQIIENKKAALDRLDLEHQKEMDTLAASKKR